MRSTHTDLDVAQEKRIGDYWNVDGIRGLSDSWTGFTRFALLNETPPKGYMWSGRRLTKNQATSRPDNIWPDAWTRIGKAAQRREKQEWAIEKLKLEYARTWSGIYSIDPSKTSLRMQGESWRHQRLGQHHAKREFSKASIRKTVVSETEKSKACEAKTRFSCIAEAHESTRNQNRISDKKDS